MIQERIGVRVGDLLTIKKLGAIEEAEIEPKQITVVIGPQASGKSLIAQSMYMFRGLKALLAMKYNIKMKYYADWHDTVIREIADDLRGVPFGYFANGTATIQFNGMKASIYTSNRRVHAQKKLRKQIEKWTNAWDADLNLLRKDQVNRNIYIPTERSLITRLIDTKPSILFDPVHSGIFRSFVDQVSMCRSFYRRLLHYYKKIDKEEIEDFIFIMGCQLKALGGEAYLPRRGPRVWKWRISSADIKAERKRKVIPIEATSSGQTDAWPFFVVAATHVLLKNDKKNFYFEEPETHLHPEAQVQILHAIERLVVSGGHSCFITTHSPFLLYAINNMILKIKSDIKKGKSRYSHIELSAYQLCDGFAEDIVDKDTGLIEEDELDRVAFELGEETDEYLDIIY